MTDTIKYIFGLLGAMVASIVIYGLFVSAQPEMYRAMDNQLSLEYLKHTGANGMRVSSIRDSVWDEYVNSIDSEPYYYGAYVEE